MLRRSIVRFHMAALIGLLILAGCYDVTAANEAPDQPIDLIDVDWQLTTLTDARGQIIPLMPDETYSIQFREDGRVEGNADCNSYSGTYVSDENGSLDIDDKISTSLALCRSGSHSMQFLDALLKASTFHIDGRVLFLRHGYRGYMTFSAPNN